jgi:ribonuclease HII
VGAVAIPIADLPMLKEYGVRDSKDLTHKKRVAMADWFHEQARQRGWFHNVIVCQPPRIDAAVHHNGLNLLEVELFAEALNPMRNKVEQGVQILNDACDVNAQRFTDRIAARLTSWPWNQSSMTSEHKADTNHAIVGMASILAKVRRDEIIEALKSEIGAPIGSGYPSDPNTKAALPFLLSGNTPHEALRWSWKTVKREWNLLHGEDPPMRPAPNQHQRTLFDA